MVSSNTGGEVIESSKSLRMQLIGTLVASMLFGASMFGLGRALYVPTDAERQHLAIVEADAAQFKRLLALEKHKATCTILDTELALETTEEIRPVYSTATASITGTGSYVYEYNADSTKRVQVSNVRQTQTLKCVSTIQRTEQDVP